MNSKLGRFLAAVALVCLLTPQLSCVADLSSTNDLLPSAGPTAPSHAANPTALPPGAFDKWTLWSSGTQLRGANIYQRRVYPELDGPEFMGSGPVGPPYTQEDFDRLAALGANYVNISHPGLFTEEPPYTLDQGIQANLDHLLEMIERADMFAAISFRTGPGRSEFTFFWDEVEDWFDESYLNDSIWGEQAAQDGWVEMWRYTAERYRDHPIVAGYDLMVEPNSNEVGSSVVDDLLEMWDPDGFFAEYGGTLYDWNQLYPRISAAIREVDAETPILIGGNGYSGVEWLPYLVPTGDPHTVYTAHQYAPHLYTHQWSGELDNTYPGAFDADWDGADEWVDRAWLDDLMNTADEFSAEHNVPVAVNEFGVVRWVPGASQFMDDLIGLFEQRGMNHALWVWDPDWEPLVEEVNAFNFRLGPDPHSIEDVRNELQDVIVRYWSRNSIRPSAVSESTAAPGPSGTLPRLADVTHWLYLIDVDLEGDTVEQIVNSEYDMVVLDFIPSEEYNTDYPMAEVMAQLHTAPHPKLVLAYIDIGEAESYRTYWESWWEVGDPEWIVGEDPDGWAENYPVAYWYDEWQEIWTGESGTLRQIMDIGFDGVYLDWVEAYSDENVTEMAEWDGVDPVQEMIWWVEDISDVVRGHCPECVVIGQNAAELVEYDDYVEAIDGIAQEQVWFDGGADNDPPGDCPLPRTEAEVDTAGYLNSLPSVCRRQYDEYPDSTLHVSSEEYLYYLSIAHDKGLPVFTVDYALDPENAAWVYRTARDLGLVPFVSSRTLDRYVEPVH